MKKITLFFLTILFVSALHAQDVMRMDDNLFARFRLDKVNMVEASGIRHVDIDGTSGKYTAKLKFGKRKFDLEVFETSSRKLMWATYSLMKTGSNVFAKNHTKSDRSTEVYTLVNNDGHKTFYEVQINKVLYTLTVEYKESGTNGAYVLASGSY